MIYITLSCCGFVALILVLSFDSWRRIQDARVRNLQAQLDVALDLFKTINRTIEAHTTTIDLHTTTLNSHTDNFRTVTGAFQQMATEKEQARQELLSSALRIKAIWDAHAEPVRPAPPPPPPAPQTSYARLMADEDE